MFWCVFATHEWFEFIGCTFLTHTSTHTHATDANYSQKCCSHFGCKCVCVCVQYTHIFHCYKLLKWMSCSIAIETILPKLLVCGINNEYAQKNFPILQQEFTQYFAHVQTIQYIDISSIWLQFRNDTHCSKFCNPSRFHWLTSNRQTNTSLWRWYFKLFSGFQNWNGKTYLFISFLLGICSFGCFSWSFRRCKHTFSRSLSSRERKMNVSIEFSILLFTILNLGHSIKIPKIISFLSKSPCF